METSFREVAKAKWQKRLAELQAIIRTPTYRQIFRQAFDQWAGGREDAWQDQERRKAFLQSFEAVYLAAKLGMEYLLDPEQPIPEIGQGCEAVHIVGQQDAPLGEGLSQKRNRRARFLLLEVDLSASKKKVLAEAEFLIRIAHDLHCQRQKREIPARGDQYSDLDWLIYDAYQKHGTYQQTMYEVFPETRGKEPNEQEVNKFFLKVKYAVQKTSKHINKAEKHIKSLFLKTS